MGLDFANLLTSPTSFVLDWKKVRGETLRAYTRARPHARVRLPEKGWEVGKPSCHAGLRRPTSEIPGWARLGGWTEVTCALAFSARGLSAHDPWHRDACRSTSSLNREVIERLLRFHGRFLARPVIKVFSRPGLFPVLRPPQLAHASRNTHGFLFGRAELANLDM